MKIKLFVACEIQYFELGIFSFNSYVYDLTRGFIASTRVFNLPTRAFSLPTRAFNLAARSFSVLTREFELVTRGFQLITRNSCLLFHVYLYININIFSYFFRLFAKERQSVSTFTTGNYLHLLLLLCWSNLQICTSWLLNLRKLFDPRKKADFKSILFWNKLDHDLRMIKKASLLQKEEPFLVFLICYGVIDKFHSFLI